MAIQIPQTQQILQSYFQTGNTPTSDQFSEFIGTMFYLYNEMINLANQEATAVAQMEALLAISGLAASSSLTYNSQNSSYSQVGTKVNIGAFLDTWQGGPVLLTFTFTTPLANALYKVYISSPGITVTSQTANQLKLTVTQAGTPTSFYFLIFP